MFLAHRDIPIFTQGKMAEDVLKSHMLFEQLEARIHVGSAACKQGHLPAHLFDYSF